MGHARAGTTARIITRVKCTVVALVTANVVVQQAHSTHCPHRKSELQSSGPRTKSTTPHTN